MAKNESVKSATPEQIAAFKMGAARRYKELGVKPQVADRLFETHLSKMAAEMGITQQPMSKTAQVLANNLRTALKQ